MATQDFTDIACVDGAIAVQPEATRSSDQSERRLRGRMLVPAHDCWHPPAIDVQDMLLVDFDKVDVGPCSSHLYLVEEMSADRVIWRGCRRISSTLGKLAIDVSGAGEWMPISTLKGIGLRIVGRVDEVYKPSLIPGAQRPAPSEPVQNDPANSAVSAYLQFLR